MCKNFNFFIYGGRRCLYKAAIILAGMLPAGGILQVQAAGKSVSRTADRLNIDITGKVTDEKGQTLPGATITEKNTKNSVAADAQGNFKLSVNGSSAVLVVSSVGYITREVAVGSQTNITIALKDATTNLNDVIVIGYGAQKRIDVTGAVSHIDEKTLREVPVTNPQQLLQGRVAGVVVTQSSNKPGAEPSVLLRGHRSIKAGNNPLYVIDGIPTNDGLNDINPNDIVSMDVLKDASATAIYGSRGANGVIIITTARGKERADGQPDVHYDSYVGVTKISRYIHNLNGPQYVDFRREAARSLPAPNTYNDADPVASDAKIFSTYELAAIAAGQYTDWQREVTQRGFQQNHDLSVLGASKTTRYNISLGYYQDKGYIKTQDYTRYNLRVNLDQDIGAHVKMGVSMLGSYAERNNAGLNPIPAAVGQIPIGTPYDASGNLASYPTGDPLMYNPLFDYVNNNVIQLEKRTRVLSSFYAQAEVWDGLKLRVNFGPDISNSRTGSFRSQFSSTNTGTTLPTAGTANEYIFSYTLENILSYDKTFGKHKIGFTGLYSVQQRVNETGSAAVKDLPVATTTYNNLGSGTMTGITSTYSRFDILSYMGRVNYNYDSRFLLTLTARADGSSVFAPGNKWGFFPSAALAYNMINEDYIKRMSFISNLKLRASYGRTGNTAVDSYGTLAVLGRTYYDFNDVAALGYYPNSIPNPNLKWETTEAYNVGLDFGIFGDRVTGSIEAYRSNTFDLLLGFALPQSTGFSQVTSNVGNTRNRGIELSLSTRNIVAKQKGGFDWTTDLTGAFNKEEIVSLTSGKVDDIGSSLFIGAPVNVNYDYRKIGIWQLGETQATQYGSSIGQIRVADQNGNGKIDPDDRSILGSPTPKYTFGINNRFSFKGFDLGVFMQGVTGNQIVSTFHTAPGQNTIAFGGRYNVVSSDYWTPQNPTNAYPRPISGTSGNPGVVFGSTLKYFDGAYLRIRNVDLGYSFPSAWMKKIGAKSVRLYFDVTNPYIFSSYVHQNYGTDPEITDSPATVNYLLGLNVRF
ncbi:TonB-dependent receptor [Mucilaginibacter mali]|uniref:TonB-dependent receptor n=1 Tax=Mucilaginibacter mali TaxID=2740462 RepID=A0A7D4Q901_9SPHI|nr:TonB-dependent receptor [Mucilaginibacter mali]QKJ29204.1 TonB-dependent receptor [Mucilaginibacter mali]